MDADSSVDREDALARLGDEIDRALQAGGVLDATALATQFKLGLDDVGRYIAALQAIQHALGEDLPSSTDLPPPSLPPDFELLGELGRGGMGIVYKVRQKSLGRVVALKVLQPAELVFGEAIRRFRTEARSLARLRHRHIVSIHEVGESGGNVYYTMDLIEGTSLADLIARKKLTPTRTVKLLRQVASAMTYAHSQGLIHRDLKPANILVDPAGDAYVVDFGLARDLAVKADLTASGYLLGTPAYMSPEQARGDSERIGEATDIYAIGAVLYECLAGKAPFGGRSLADTIHAVIHAEPIPPRRVASSTPRDLEIICLKAMAKEPERRYATVRAMMEDLERFEGGLPIRARRPSVAYRLAQFARRNKISIVASIIAATLLGLLLLTVVLPKIGQTPTTLLSTAEDLHRAGEHQAALMLCERALSPRPGGELEERVRSSMVRCRIDVAHVLEAQSRWDEADRLCERKIPGATEAQKIELLWERARCQGKIGRSEKATKLLGTITYLIEEQLRSNPEISYESDREDLAINALLDRMAPALLDPQDPGHEAAGGFIAQAFENSSSADQIRHWLLAQRDHVSQIFVACLPYCVNLAERSHLRTPFEFAEKLRDPQLEKLLAGIVEDPRQSEESQALAAEILSQQADLPFLLRDRYFDVELPKPAPETCKRLVSIWKQVQSLSSADRYRCLIDAALSELARVSAEGWRSSWTMDWLQDHTGQSKAVDRKYRPAGEWRVWWDQHRAEDPREHLGKALEIAPTSDLETILQKYLPCVEVDQRLWFHHLLVLSLPVGVQAPIGRGCRSRESDGRPMAWYRTIRKDRPEPPYLLRRARFILRDGDPEPTLLWEESMPLLLGEEVRPQRRFRTDSKDSLRWEFLVPGFEAGMPWEGTIRESISGYALLEWQRDGTLFLRGGEGGVQGMIVPSDQLHEKDKLWPGHMEASIILSVAEPPGADPRPLSLSGWKAKLVQQLKFLADGMNAESGTKNGGPFSMRYQQSAWLLPRIGTFIPLPEARESLIRMNAALLSMAWGVHIQAEQLCAARLLAGDGNVLSEPDTRKHLSAGPEHGFDPTAAYWLRVVLANQDPRIVSVALENLDNMEIPPPVAVRLKQAIDTGKVIVPGRLAQRAAAAEAEVRSKDTRPRFRYKLAGVIGAIVAGVLLGFAFRPSHNTECRLIPAALLVVAGVFYASLSVELNGWDLFPDAGGYALAALGCLMLARPVTISGRYIPSLGFAMAMVADVAGRLGLAKFALLYVASLFAAIAISSMPILIRGLDTSIRTGLRTPKRWLLLAIFPFFPLGVIIYHGFAIARSVERGEIRGPHYLDEAVRIALLAILCVGAVSLLMSASLRARSKPSAGVGVSSPG